MLVRGTMAVVIAVVTGFTSVRPAQADYRATWVAATCDGPTGLAMARFGYADAEDPPKFIEVSRDIDGGLSAKPVTNANRSEASCTLPNGRELKIRRGFGPFSTGPDERFSVWVDKIRIIHAEDIEKLPYAVIVNAKGFRRCYFRLAGDQSAYDLTNTPIAGGQTPVQCDKEISPISGQIDLEEYPPPGSPPPPRVGSIAIEASADDRLCHGLIAKNSELNDQSAEDAVYFDFTGRKPDDEVISPRKIGKAAKLDWADLAPTDKGTQIRSAIYDLRNSGQPERVYEISGETHYFDGNYFMVVPRSVSEDEVKAFLLDTPDDVEAIADLAVKKGWGVLTGFATPYKDLRYSRFRSIIRSSGITYLLVERPGLEPSGVLMRPKANGSMDKICTFQVVSPHF